MPVSIKGPLTIGTRASLSGNHKLVYNVYGLSQSHSVELRLHKALSAVDATSGKRIPVKGQGHPNIIGLVVDDVEAEPLMRAPDKARVTVTYKLAEQVGGGSQPTRPEEEVLNEGGTIVRLHNTVFSTTTHYDKFGQLMLIGYKPNAPPTFKTEPNDPNRLTSILRANIYDPESTLEFVRLEDKSPWRLNLQYRKRLNRDRWQGSNPRSWLCLGVSGDWDVPRVGVRDVPSRKRRISYLFRALDLDQPSRMIRTHDPLGVFIDKRTGEPPPDIDPRAGGFPRQKEGNGWKQFELYYDALFGPLGLPDVSL